MTLRNRPDQWGSVAVTLHWSSVPMLVATLAVGWVAEHRAGGALQELIYELHFSLGLLTLLVMLLRAGWRLFDPPPRHPSNLGRLQLLVARGAHTLLYLVTLSALISGMVNFLFIVPIRVFGVLEVPRLFDPVTQEPLRAISWYAHIYSYWLLLILLGAHVAAALHHQFVRRDQLLSKFWFSRQ